jgi:ATP-dependent Zn protease
MYDVVTALLPFILLLGFWFFLMQRFRAGGPENPMLAKLEEIRQELEQIREELRRRSF